MISDESVERVREAADIVQIVGEHVELKRSGADFRGPCPFHHGTHRNFAVSPKKNLYYCFVCHEHGDVFDFVRRHLGLDWPSAVRYVAEKSGVEVHETDGRREGPDPREPYWEVLTAAAELFTELLWSDAAAAPARDYLAQRQVTREQADRFALGFAPRDDRALRGRLSALGFGDERLEGAGLLVRREEGGGLRPRFRDRLMFPIADPAGHVVGFGGRLLGPGEPKYLNSPETPVFDKGRLLYHLDRAKQSIRVNQRALVVEGYFDVLRLASAGEESVVAPLGTALTEAQAALLARYTRNVFLLYDSDKAGLNATFRAGLELLRHGVRVRVVTLPEGEDPDSFVARHGRDHLERQLGGAMDLFERQIQILERRGYFADLHRKRIAVDRLLPTIRAAGDPLTRELYLGRLSEVAGVDRATLASEVEEGAKGGRRGGGGAGGTDGATAGGGQAPADEHPIGVSWRDRTQGHGPGRRRSGERRWRGERRADPELVDVSRPRPRGNPGQHAERYLVLAMLHLDGQIEAIARQVRPESFRDPLFAEIFSVLVERGAVGDMESLAESLSDEAARELQRLLLARGELDPPGRIIDDSLAQLRYLELTEQIDEIERLEREAQGDRRAALQQERLRLVEERRALGVRGNWTSKLGHRTRGGRE
ncbi:MAG TPA: DNA primase [Gemmatimonadaceae bacterium]|nr:DNA primase [Gemmatimonadaceae bacterium]